MRTIWKETVKLTDSFKLELPIGAEVLTLRVQDGHPYIWFKVADTNAPKVTRTFFIYGTGTPINEDFHRTKYIGTWQTHSLVWHLFEEVKRS